jgi:heme/copper-type cytochrome/quinol oxidase subunit 3
VNKKESNDGRRPKEPGALWLRLLPDLKQIRPIELGATLAQAKTASLPTLEIIAIVIWLVIVTSFTKYILAEGNMTNDAASTIVANLVITVPMLAILFIPIHIRRFRRGVHEQLQKKDKQ